MFSFKNCDINAQRIYITPQKATPKKYFHWINMWIKIIKLWNFKKKKLKIQKQYFIKYIYSENSEFT